MSELCDLPSPVLPVPMDQLVGSYLAVESLRLRALVPLHVIAITLYARLQIEHQLNHDDCQCQCSVGAAPLPLAEQNATVPLCLRLDSVKASMLVSIWTI